MDEIEALVRHVPDFPRPGVGFKDITPLLADASSFSRCIDLLTAPWLNVGVDVICGIESRGFIFGAAMATRMGTGFVPLRKAGKLPPLTVGVDYALEYGTDRLEARVDALRPGQRVLVVDDVLATGGTLEAGRQLVENLGARVVGASVVIELSALAGRARWAAGAPLRTLLKY